MEDPELVELSRQNRLDALRKSEKFTKANRAKIHRWVQSLPAAKVFKDGCSRCQQPKYSSKRRFKKLPPKAELVLESMEYAAEKQME